MTDDGIAHFDKDYDKARDKESFRLPITNNQ